MKITKPRKKTHRDQRLLRVVPSGPRDLSRLTQCPFPFRQDIDNGDFLVHISTVERFMVRKYVKAVDPYAREQIKAYAREIIYSFKDKDQPEKPSHTDDWLKHLDPAHFLSKPYQIMGMQRLYNRMTEWNSGQVLGDDVGLGKTPQTIGVICRLKSEGLLHGAIISTTVSTQHQWVDEFARMASPKLKVVAITGGKQERLARLKEPADIYVLNHASVRYEHYWTEIKRIVKSKIDLLVIDESSAIKNPATITHDRWFQIADRIKWSLMLNATAIENGLDDLWANIRFVDPRMLGNHPGFDTRYVVRNEYNTQVGSRNLKELRKRVALGIYRRTPDDVGEQLPQIQVTMRNIELTGKQKKYYEMAVGEAMEGDSHGAIRLTRLAKVQKAALGTMNTSGKLEDLHDLLHGDLRGERVVIFSKFKDCVEIASHWLEEFKPFHITGDTTQKNRANIQRRFSSKHGAGRVLICTEAADRGLNLQAAGVVVNLDLPWNPAKLRQRIGRINRVSQERARILVINYIAKHPNGGTIDDYMMQKIIPKRELFRDVLGDADVDELGNEKIDPEALTKYISSVLTKRKTSNRRRVKA